MGGKGLSFRRKPESSFDFIQFFKTLDASFRWHDEIRHSLRWGRARVGVMKAKNFEENQAAGGEGDYGGQKV
jgi:hypothetical protein